MVRGWVHVPNPWPHGHHSTGIEGDTRKEAWTSIQGQQGRDDTDLHVESLPHSGQKVVHRGQEWGQGAHRKAARLPRSQASVSGEQQQRNQKAHRDLGTEVQAVSQDVIKQRDLDTLQDSRN